ncbi:interferon-inducible GTPase-domain-containing protein, partial [Morchella snyderi]
MLPLLALGFLGVAWVGVVGVGVVYLCSGPTKQNESLNKVEENLESEERRATEEQERKKAAEMFEEERKSIEERERELERATSRLALEQDRVRAEVDGRMEEEKGRRKTEDETRKRLEEDKQKLAERIRKLEKREKEQNEARLEAEKRFGGPLRWPTREEYQETLSRTKYDKSHFHFGIAGRAGSGKSSLINAFRNLGNKDEGAARTGTKETTLETARYPDPGTEPPRKWMVWFDVPGAGTKRIPHKDYFIKQGLYVLDLLILAIGDRFEEIDARIIEDCARFKVPVFIVRSKADMHILNTMKEHNDECARITDDPALYRTCREQFVNESQETVSEELERQDLPDQAVYVVSRDVLRRTYSRALRRQGTITDGGQKEEVGAIHEGHLVKEILAAAVKRRCDTGGWLAAKVRTRTAMLQSSHLPPPPP